MPYEKRVDIQDALFLVGPTASGKTPVGICLAEQLEAEIISLDSMAVYRGMDIGTAKPTPAERSRVRHHLIDIIEPGEEYSLARYLDDVERALDEIRSRRRRALFVGGTPLYLKALLRGMFEGPGADWELREQLRAWANAHGSEALHAKLSSVDPEAARRIHPHDLRRIIRALEVYEKTGQPLSQWQRQFDHPLEVAKGRVLVLDWPRELLYQRINRRVDEMFAEGLVEEVQQLLARGCQLSHTARQALGYREVLEYLEGKRSYRETVELVKTRTRQFAKRQLTWFRHLEECRFMPVSEPFRPENLAERILREYWWEFL
ncbi:tRNA (adenosine(37)-N6)-dimethylallyltransferase MiaA [Thermogutta sp.]|uniref:tRNA (adenosine(37)-N6)-dimethylallyltransferase MiaA n=1 Tax=Thermogutta sp. TaxID=1962930 RepID=UPI003C7BD51E